MESSDQTDLIDVALFEAQQAMGNVSKKRTHPTGYKYANLVDYMDVLSAVLVEAGLFVISETCNLRPSTRPVKSGQWYACYLQMNMRVIHVASGQWREIATEGEGQHSGDKDVYVATTTTRKYAYAQMFAMLTVDDAEAQPDPELPGDQTTDNPPAGGDDGIPF